jgi:hypothetical protein
MALVTAPGHYDGDGCRFPPPDDDPRPHLIPEDEVPAATSLVAGTRAVDGPRHSGPGLVAGSIGRSLVDAAAAYKAKLARLLTPDPEGTHPDDDDGLVWDSRW